MKYIKPVTDYYKHKMQISLAYKRELMQKITYEEKLLHKEFKLLGRNPKRQKLFWNKKTWYILDLYFGDKKVCIEIDGLSHLGRENYDKERDEFLLKNKGIITLRFTNNEVKKYSKQIAILILDFINKLPKYNHNGRKRTNPNNIERIALYNGFLKSQPATAIAPHRAVKETHDYK